DSASPFLGEIRPFAGNYAPRNWAMCNGANLPIRGYTALFSLLGNTFGGQYPTSFALPDLRNRIPVGTRAEDRSLGALLGVETEQSSNDPDNLRVYKQRLATTALSWIICVESGLYPGRP